MGMVLAIANQKGGVGKTTSSVNLSACLAYIGKKVLLVDIDPQGNATSGAGIDKADVEQCIYDVLVDDVEASDVIRETKVEKLYIIPATIQLAGAEIELVPTISREVRLKRALEEVKEDYDYIIIDCPAGIEQGYKNAVAGADQAIVVTTPEVSAVRDADRIIGLLEKEENVESPRLVINRIRNHMMKSGDMLDVDEITTHLSIDLIGIVADDDEVIKASNHGEPIAMNPNSKASIAYRNIARRILGESVPLQQLDAEDKGMFNKIKRFFGVK